MTLSELRSELGPFLLRLLYAVRCHPGRTTAELQSFFRCRSHSLLRQSRNRTALGIAQLRKLGLIAPAIPRENYSFTWYPT